MNEPMKEFIASYNYDGASWNLRFHARDFDDAQARLARMSFARLDGEVQFTLPAIAGPLAWIAVAVRNAISWVFATDTPPPSPR